MSTAPNHGESLPPPAADVEAAGTPLADANWPHGRVGYVALLGRPNVGKSTLLNSLLGYHLVPVTAKPQTTRRKCLGILSDVAAGYQVLFLDTPGLHRSRNRLDEAMEKTIRRALDDADVVLCMLDCTRRPGDEDDLAVRAAGDSGKPVLVAINKADVGRPEQIAAAQAFVYERVPSAACLTSCATDRGALSPLLDALLTMLPQGPFFYPPDSITDTYERDIGAELIREVLLEMLHDEVPHAMAVTVEAWKEEGDRRRIDAVLHVERAQHKGIVIGHGGVMLRQIRSESVRRLVELCQCRVELNLHVKVDENWRSNLTKVREFDYGRY